jgi:hypothetical protein
MHTAPEQVLAEGGRIRVDTLVTLGDAAVTEAGGDALPLDPGLATTFAPEGAARPMNNAPTRARVDRTAATGPRARRDKRVEPIVLLS